MILITSNLTLFISDFIYFTFARIQYKSFVTKSYIHLLLPSLPPVIDPKHRDVMLLRKMLNQLMGSVVLGFFQIWNTTASLEDPDRCSGILFNFFWSEVNSIKN
jgi:hypothetical protein